MKNIGGKYMQYLWIALLALSTALECFTAKGIFLCFVPSSLGGVILAFLGVDIRIQLAVFAGLFLLSILFLRPLAMRLLLSQKSTAFSVQILRRICPPRIPPQETSCAIISAQALTT